MLIYFIYLPLFILFISILFPHLAGAQKAIERTVHSLYTVARVVHCPEITGDLKRSHLQGGYCKPPCTSAHTVQIATCAL